MDDDEYQLSCFPNALLTSQHSLCLSTQTERNERGAAGYGDLLTSVGQGVEPKDSVRLRVAVVRHDRFPGEPHLRRSVHALRDAGFDVDVICDHEPGLPRYERTEGVTVLRLLFQHKRHSLLRYAFEYAMLPLVAGIVLGVRSFLRPYTYVEVDNPPDWLVLSGIIPRLRGAKVILYMFENMPELLAADRGLSPDHPMMRALIRLQRLCARAAYRLIAPHEMASRILIDQGIPPDRIAAVVPNGPDTRIFLSHVSPKAGDGAANHSHPSSSTFRLVTHGTMLQRYGIETLLEAVALLHDRIPGLHLDVIGDGEYKSRLAQLAHELKLCDVVTFVDRVPFDELAVHLSKADIGVVPVWAPFVPNKLMEYLALGLPVITTDWPAVRLYFDDQAVRYVEPKNAHALAEAIIDLYRNPSQRASLARIGHRVYQERYAWDRVKHHYLAVYR